MITLTDAKDAIKALWENGEDPAVTRDVVLNACRALLYPKPDDCEFPSDFTRDLADAALRAVALIDEKGNAHDAIRVSVLMTAVIVSLTAKEGKESFAEDTIVQLLRAGFDVCRDAKKAALELKYRGA